MALREIKFRGIAESSKRWVYGNTIICDYDIHQMFICDTHAGYRKFDWEEVVNKTVGQFTGLHDSNGVEIYEGDIIRLSRGKIGYPAHSQRYVVRFDLGFVCYMLPKGCFSKPIGDLMLLRDRGCNLEVIGNVFSEGGKK